MKVCDAFCALEHDVRLWLPGPEPRVAWSELASLYGIRNQFPIQWINALRFLRRYDFAIRSVLAGRSWKADLYYVWTLQAAAFASCIKLPTVLEMHDRPSGRFGSLLFRLFLMGQGASRLLPITKALREWLSSAYDREFDEPFAIISPMGVDLERYADLPEPERAREMLALPEKFTVGYTGHLYPGRGLDLLYKLAVRNPEVQFLWVGGEARAIQIWKTRLVQEDVQNIRLQGFVPNEELPLYQAACEVLAMPYEQKVSISGRGDTASYASPMKIFEYLAAGRVIFSSDLPVLQEVLNPSNAVILPIQNLNAWDEALREIIEDPNRRIALARHAKQDVLRYSWVERAERSLDGL
jgi:glycosyltransferase involved in cell wall biosynthesis